MASTGTPAHNSRLSTILPRFGFPGRSENHHRAQSQDLSRRPSFTSPFTSAHNSNRLLRKERRAKKLFSSFSAFDPRPSATLARSHSTSNVDSGSLSMLSEDQPDMDFGTQGESPSLPLIQEAFLESSGSALSDGPSSLHHTQPLAMGPPPLSVPPTDGLSTLHTTQPSSPNKVLNDSFFTQGRRRSWDISTPSEPLESSRLHRSRSLSHKQLQQQHADHQVPLMPSPFSKPLAISERQRAINVRRARKMTQLFGREPPLELIRYASTDHPSNTSISSTPALTPSLSRPLSQSSLESLLSLHDATEVTKPPPTVASEDVDTQTLADGTNTSKFNERRQRAARLARFFGVEQQDMPKLSENITPAKPPNEATPPPDMQVHVKMTRRRYWFAEGRSTGQDMEMQEVIDRLRDLKAS